MKALSVFLLLLLAGFRATANPGWQQFNQTAPTAIPGWPQYNQTAPTAIPGWPQYNQTAPTAIPGWPQYNQTAPTAIPGWPHYNQTAPTAIPGWPYNQSSSPGTCNVCFGNDLASCEFRQTSLPCSVDQFPNVGTTHCYTGTGSYKYHDHPSIFTGVARGCINCADKNKACTQLAQSFESNLKGILLDCIIECCTEDNCNNRSIIHSTQVPGWGTVPSSEAPSTRIPSSKELEDSLVLSFLPIMSSRKFKWDYRVDKSFKEAVAHGTTSYCTFNRARCSLKTSLRHRRDRHFFFYDADHVHLLPGYPDMENLRLAFYVQQPLGWFIGNASVVPRDTLVDIVSGARSWIERATGITVINVEFLIPPSSTTSSKLTTQSRFLDEGESSRVEWKWIAIGVCVGAAVIISLSVIFIVLLWLKNRERERCRVQTGAEKVAKNVVRMEAYCNEAVSGQEPRADTHM
ncbi:uncharacterized protein [Montipora foliosa]|uniref:uncharacterized protein isoform X3 n=1 Tax=Montipora foliosa TaxID=591990 RepID=UPI0035F12143